jgi:hypothetical protein
MKNIILKTVTTLLLSINLFSNSFSQPKITTSITTINYNNWTPPSPLPCNLFASLTSINGVSHLTTFGAPLYNNTNSENAVQLQAKVHNGSEVQGTEYKIQYPFKKNYSYKITVLVKKKYIAETGGGNVTLHFDINDGGTTTNNQCTGPQPFLYNYSSNEKAIGITNTADYANYEVPWSQLSSDQNYMMIGAKLNSVIDSYQDIYIRQITIEEILDMNFSLSPSPIPISCGSTSPQSFAITPNDVYGVSYQWSLPSSNNGWKYNGSDAPQILPVSSSSVSLTPICGTTPQNVSVTVKVNGINYETYTTSVATGTNFTIIGSSTICLSNSVYSVENLPCNSNVTWSVSNPNIVSLSSTTGNSVTLTRISDGDFTLSAQLSNTCNGSQPSPKQIHIGKPFVMVDISSNGNYSALPSGTNNLANYNSVCNYQDVFLNMYVTGASSVNWNKVSSSATNIYWSQNSNNLYFYFFNVGQTALFRINASNACGTTTQDYGFKSIDCSSTGCDVYAVSPNPASESIDVGVPNIPPPPTCLTTSQFNELDIAQITIYDQDGTRKLNQKFAAKTKRVHFNLNGLKKGIYIIEISSKNYLERKQIIIAK